MSIVQHLDLLMSRNKSIYSILRTGSSFKKLDLGVPYESRDIEPEGAVSSPLMKNCENIYVEALLLQCLSI